MYDKSDILYEIVAPNGPNSPVNDVVSRGNEYLNHNAHTTKIFDEEIIRLRKLGMIPLGPIKNAKVFEGSRIIFFLRR